MLKDIVNNCYNHALEKQKTEGYIVLERGLTTIPLAGIDAPFHSRYLWSGVMPFRAFLYKWDEEHWNAPEQWQKLSWVLLVELLSYQFASPVRWIETQDLFFGQYRFERFIEIGPSSTLTGMAVRTLKARYEAMDDSTSVVRRVFCASKHQKEIYYQFEDDSEVTSGPDAASETAPPAPTPLPSVPVAVATATPAAAGPAVTIEDTPIRAVDIFAAIVSQKLKKQLSEIPLSKSIRDLSNGKSTLQNEIMGGLQGDFSSAPDKDEELPLEDLDAALAPGHSSNLRIYSTNLASGGKMPGGFNISSAKAHISKAWGLGPQRADAVLLIATTMEPAKHMGSEAEGKAGRCTSLCSACRHHSFYRWFRQWCRRMIWKSAASEVATTTASGSDPKPHISLADLAKKRRYRAPQLFDLSFMCLCVRRVGGAASWLLLAATRGGGAAAGGTTVNGPWRMPIDSAEAAPAAEGVPA
ncbi:hypothetical protein BGW80DRAFT_1445979 [Lactifluus volemus]|nr:hypothetical protein BGW80DRAFT_1445979 [Lactifluus volemus]